MRFYQWLAQQEEVVPRQLPVGAQYQGVQLIAGQTNYALESISGVNTTVPVVEGFLAPLTRPQLERLRDRLIQMFPLPAVPATAGGGTGAGGAGHP
jgi:hypothetical protein